MEVKLYPQSDLESLENLNINLEKLDGKKITFLGGTGFVGSWLLHILNAQVKRNGIYLNVEVVTRNKNHAKVMFENLKNIEIQFISHDLTSNPLFTLCKTDFLVHGATPSVIKTGYSKPEDVYLASINGAKTCINLAEKFGNNPFVMHLSSGAIYGKNEVENSQFLESQIEENKLTFLTPYMRAKLDTEKLLSQYKEKNVLDVVNPRLFTFAGPGIAIDEHFAVGNFLANALKGEPIIINGNPNTTRSYLYPIDMAAALLKVLIGGSQDPVNIGSDKSLNMLELACIISKLFGNHGIKLLNPEASCSSYVPSIAKLKSIYNVDLTIDIEDGLTRWFNWLKNSKNN